MATQVQPTLDLAAAGRGEQGVEAEGQTPAEGGSHLTVELSWGEVAPAWRVSVGMCTDKGKALGQWGGLSGYHQTQG